MIRKRYVVVGLAFTAFISLIVGSTISSPVGAQQITERPTNMNNAALITNSSGFATVLHGLGVPVKNVVLGAGGPSAMASLQWRGASTPDRRDDEFLVQARKFNGGVLANTLITFSWLAEGCLSTDIESWCQIPTPTPSPSASPSPTFSPSPSPSPTLSPSSSPSPSPAPGGFPGPNNTGVPSGTVLTTYTGPCTITVPNTAIDAKQVNCQLTIATTGVLITRSKLLGISGNEGSGASFRVEDSTIDVTPTSDQGVIADGISGDNFTALRVNVFGSNRGVYCHRNATIQDSWIHGTEINPTSNWHASALRVEQGCNVIHNTLACDWLIPTPLDGGCSADLTGYPDFAPIKDNLIQNNLFVANPTGAAFCAYGGASAGKPFSGDPTNATNIRFIDNIFQVGPDPARGECADFGPITDFSVGRTGNVWQNNLFDDGRTVNP